VSAKWQTGVDGRTLHHHGRMVGAMDSAELADLVVVALNTATSNADILSAIRRLEIKVMAGQESIDAAVAAVQTAVTGIAAVANDLVAAAANIQAEIAALGTPVDTTALDAAVTSLNDAVAPLQAAQAQVDALETPPAETSEPAA